MKDFLKIRGAKEHNLKNVDVDVPRNKFIVFTGVSGSGKSSLAFDTIYAEGQRRYVESLTSYARQFLGQMERPEIDSIEGLSPAISIDQKTTARNPRSTVGTVTEIYDYLRLLFARTGIPHCPVCGKEISPMTVDQIVGKVMALGDGTRIQILAPVVRGRKGTYVKQLQDYSKQGFVRCRVDGEVAEITDIVERGDLDKNKKHDIEIVVDRLAISKEERGRIAGSIETALRLTENLVMVQQYDTGEEALYNTSFSCAEHGVGIAEMEPRMFSFNAPFGACPDCDGLGEYSYVDEELVIPDDSLSISECAIASLSKNSDDGYYWSLINGILDYCGASAKTPFRDLPEKAKNMILYGTGDTKIKFSFVSGFDHRGMRTVNRTFEGVVKNIERRHKESFSDMMRNYFENFMSINECPRCHGARLKDEVLAVTVGGKNIYEVTQMSVLQLINFFENLEYDDSRQYITEQIVGEILSRLRFLRDVGLDYLTLSRGAGSLSGGEAQRIRLATQIGSRLVGVMYILDEPSIGLHQKDNQKLIDALRELTELGNTLIVVEHDEDTMRSADYIVDLGPGAGEMGGELVVAGTVDEVCAEPRSVTGQYLSGKKKIAVPEKRSAPQDGRAIVIHGAEENNLRKIDVAFPLGLFTVVTGVSGSGKSTLVNEILYKEAYGKINHSRMRPGKFASMDGLELIDKVIEIDQSPIGRTPRSNPATYTGVFDYIRDLFADTRDARQHGFKKGRFSFNVRGGRCEHCKGDGQIKIEMHFLPDVYVDCDVCGGKRYNRETLECYYKDKNIDDVLNMTVDEALEFFSSVPKIKRKLQTIQDVGLGYVRLGQPSPQLSGGEAQRMKLASELSKVSTGSTLYLLDEPTTGLHSADVQKLIDVLQRLVDAGNTVVVIEHNLDVIKCADHIIDLGPDGGDGGGTVVATGTPEEVAKVKNSYTGQFLKRILAGKSTLGIEPEPAEQSGSKKTKTSASKSASNKEKTTKKAKTSASKSASNTVKTSTSKASKKKTSASSSSKSSSSKSAKTENSVSKKKSTAKKPGKNKKAK